MLRYQKRISGPLLDRIDIHITVPRVEYEKLRRSLIKTAMTAHHHAPRESMSILLDDAPEADEPERAGVPLHRGHRRPSFSCSSRGPLTPSLGEVRKLVANSPSATADQRLVLPTITLSIIFSRH